jgi:hypothetical protein
MTEPRWLALTVTRVLLEKKHHKDTGSSLALPLLICVFCVICGFKLRLGFVPPIPWTRPLAGSPDSCPCHRDSGEHFFLTMDYLTSQAPLYYMLCSSLKRPRHIVEYRRKSACGYGHRRIGNRMQVPDGCAAVTEDEGPINATFP